MTHQLYQYLKNEWITNNHPKYQHYFEDWVNYYNQLWLKN